MRATGQSLVLFKSRLLGLARNSYSTRGYVCTQVSSQYDCTGTMVDIYRYIIVRMFWGVMYVYIESYTVQNCRYSDLAEEKQSMLLVWLVQTRAPGPQLSRRASAARGTQGGARAEGPRLGRSRTPPSGGGRGEGKSSKRVMCKTFHSGGVHRLHAVTPTATATALLLRGGDLDHVVDAQNRNGSLCGKLDALQLD